MGTQREESNDNLESGTSQGRISCVIFLKNDSPLVLSFIFLATNYLEKWRTKEENYTGSLSCEICNKFKKIKEVLNNPTTQ